MIELKYALSSTGEYQRLVGQLVDYKDWGKQFILVLAGETEPNLFKQLDKELQRQFEGRSPFEGSAKIICKSI